MWVSKKKLYELEKRIADLEKEVQSQPEKITCATLNYLKATKRGSSQKEAKELQSSRYIGERKIEDVCVFHWLNCLYKDFLNKRIAGEQFPCLSCPEMKNCKNCPPLNFNLAGEKFGLKVEYRKAKPQVLQKGE